jgi:DNA modification methylase
MKPYYSHAGITIYHGDCREILPTLPKCDLLLTDPPYGIRVGRVAHAASGNVVGHGNRRVAKRTYELSTWDDATPSEEVLLCARGMASWSIIFGGNYFSLPASRCWLIWDKLNGDNNFADCELAWTNLDKSVRKIEWLWNGFARENGEQRFDHPTQKPVGVMPWCITQAPDAQTILDPFMGSGTTLVAAKNLGRKAVGIEIEEKYCEIAAKRLSQEVFDFNEVAI